jgi:hypothetical protein
MDNALDQLLTFGTMVFAVSIVIVTFFVRRIVETAWPVLRKQADENDPAITYSSSAARWYQTVVLYAIPVVAGGLIGLIKIPYFFPETVQTAGGRLFFGGVVGWFSSAVYKVVKRMLAKRGVDLPGGSLAPSPVPPPPNS